MARELPIFYTLPPWIPGFPTLASQHYALGNYMPFFSGQNQELVQR